VITTFIILAKNEKKIVFPVVGQFLCLWNFPVEMLSRKIINDLS
jgi:hypothetical protein